MEGVLEQQRKAHEELDRLEQHIVNEMLVTPPTQKARLRQELLVSSLLDQIAQTANNLRSTYEGPQQQQTRQQEIEAISIPAGSEFGDFYNRLKNIKDDFRRIPADRLVDDAEFESILNSATITEDAFEVIFSGEEMHGRFLDLLIPYQRYINLKGVRTLDYLQFIQEFDNFAAIPMTTKLTHGYEKYLFELQTYFKGFFKRAKPLFNLNETKKNTLNEFESSWKDIKVIGWEEASKKDQEAKESIFCKACSKNFTNASVYQAHLGGKKHIKAAASGEISHAEMSSNDNNECQTSTCKKLAQMEFLITRYTEILGQVREETRSNVECKHSRTMEERANDLENEDINTEKAKNANEDEESADNDGQIYNPLNLPLDWDGKPIPFWLWRLHGLGVRFPCEICGNHVYMGRKAFDQHFFEWRHSHGMKALGIPNTKHFFQITRIDEAQAIWDKLKQVTRSEVFRPEAMEEFEDHQGNVYNRKTYEDLRRQGLI